MLDICEFLRVEGVSHGDVVKAIGMKDFKDCLQDKCAESIGAHYIITRNVKDYDGSTVQAVSPEEFLETISDKS